MAYMTREEAVVGHGIPQNGREPPRRILRCTPAQIGTEAHWGTLYNIEDSSLVRGPSPLPC